MLGEQIVGELLIGDSGQHDQGSETPSAVVRVGALFGEFTAVGAIPSIPTSIYSTQFGTPTATHVARATSIKSTRFGTPTTPFNWVAQAQSLPPPVFGTPYGMGGPIIIDNISVQAKSWCSTVFGQPT